VYVVYEQKEQLSGYHLDLEVKNHPEFAPLSLTSSLIVSSRAYIPLSRMFLSFITYKVPQAT
jgi:hypothetical protein